MSNLSANAQLLGNLEHTTAELAELFGVARATVYRAVERARGAEL